MKKFPRNKRGSLAAKERTEQSEASVHMDSMEPSYRGVIEHMKKIRAREIAQRDIIQAACKKLKKYRPQDLIATNDSLATQKKVDELEVKNKLDE